MKKLLKSLLLVTVLAITPVAAITFASDDQQADGTLIEKDNDTAGTLSVPGGNGGGGGS